MIKILTAQQIREVDRLTIEREPVASIDLMERASRGFVDWFYDAFRPPEKVGIICGTGNNGGDGLAIARMLRDFNYSLRIWVVQGSSAGSEDFKINLARLQEAGQSVVFVTDTVTTPEFIGCEVLIDALFGTGLTRAVDGVYARVIKAMNAADAVRVAVDMPSGLSADSAISGDIVEADHTVSFGLPKLSFFLPDFARYVGQWHVVDIGLDRSAIREQESDKLLVTKKSVRKILRPRRPFDHKGTFGHALFVGGSHGKIGAATLACMAALRAGVGLLTAYIPRCGYTVLQTAVPECMLMTDPADTHLTEAPDVERFQAVGVGPGLGQHAATAKMLRQLLSSATVPVVLDADALNLVSSNRELMHLIPKGSILTPHPKEFERLAGSWKNGFERLDLQKKLAAQLESIVVVKGAYTTIATPAGKMYFNSTGNPGLATGGTGDVLTGILTGLMARGYSAEESAILGVYLHGLAADLGATELGQESFLASDLISFLPSAFLKLRR